MPTERSEAARRAALGENATGLTISRTLKGGRPTWPTGAGLTGPLALLVIGVLLLLRNLGYLPASLDQWWPAILILIGLWILFIRSAPGETMSPKGPVVTPPASQAPTTEGRRHAATGGLILVGLGLALLASNLLGGRSAGPLIMIAVGLALLIGRIW
jgi:hypothetical protein